MTDQPVARLVEQPEDWTEPGAWLVAPGVHRIPLRLPDPQLHAVNAYLIEDARGPVLVDPGWDRPETVAELSAALGPLGLALDDVAQVLVTHAHRDHYTQALAMRERFGARVRLGRGERVSIEAAAAGREARQPALLRRCGADALADWVTERIAESAGTLPPMGPPDSWLDDRERIGLDGRVLDVFATPGHTRGHVVLRDAAAGLLFSGDHVLPHISPSLAIEPVPQSTPLRSFLESLELVRAMPDTLLLPAHGPAAPSVHVRVEELLDHHARRLEAAAAEVRVGRATALEVSQAMSWTRHQRKFDDLEASHQMLAVLEIEAHLAVLAERGVLVLHEQDGVNAYGYA